MVKLSNSKPILYVNTSCQPGVDEAILVKFRKAVMIPPPTAVLQHSYQFANTYINNTALAYVNNIYLSSTQKTE